MEWCGFASCTRRSAHTKSATAAVVVIQYYGTYLLCTLFRPAVYPAMSEGISASSSAKNYSHHFLVVIRIPGYTDICFGTSTDEVRG